MVQIRGCLCWDASVCVSGIFQDPGFWVDGVADSLRRPFSRLDVVPTLSRERPAAKCPLSGAVFNSKAELDQWINR